MAGRGLFALDVTDPSTFRESNAAKTVLWEFTNANDAHLGYTYSRPTITLMNNGRWALITGNGLEDTATDRTGGQAQLFIIYLDGGVDGTWTYGTDYLRISTGSGSTSSRNGLLSPAVVDLDRNGTADRIYAGDLLGSLWSFDVSKTTDTKWSLAHNGQSLFSGSSGQSITTKPTVIRHPTVTDGSAPNLMVLFGSGRFLADGDKTRSNTQSFYGVWDNNTGGLTRSNLARQTFLLDDASKRARVLDPYLKVEYEKMTGRQYGWYIDLPAKGERVVSEALVRGGIVYFNSIIPDVSVCASGGGGWEMSVKTENGGSPDAPVFDFNEDGAVTVSGDTASVSGRSGASGEENISYAGKKLEEEKGMPAGPSIIGNRRFTPGTATDEGAEMEETLLITNEATVTGRLSWEQLFPD
ncbi:MAG: pilus assembly protein [Arenicellales bacterium]